MLQQGRKWQFYPSVPCTCALQVSTQHQSTWKIFQGFCFVIHKLLSSVIWWWLCLAPVSCSRGDWKDANQRWSSSAIIVKANRPCAGDHHISAPSYVWYTGRLHCRCGDLKSVVDVVHLWKGDPPINLLPQVSIERNCQMICSILWPSWFSSPIYLWLVHCMLVTSAGVPHPFIDVLDRLLFLNLDGA